MGRNNGVSKLLKDHVPYLLSNHCIAHRLALACGQAANEIRFLKDVLDQPYHFYKHSPVSTAGLNPLPIKCGLRQLASIYKQLLFQLRPSRFGIAESAISSCYKQKVN